MSSGMLPYGYGYAGPGITQLTGGYGPGYQEAVPAVPLDQPKPVIRYGESSLWSSTFLAAGAIAGTQARLFSTQRGQIGQGYALALSVAETNIKEPGRIPNGVAFDIYGIACQILHNFGAADVAGGAGAGAGAPADTDNQIGNLLSVIQNGIVSWDFTQTQVFVAPINLIGAGGGAFGAVSTADTGTPGQIGHMNNGTGSVWLYRRYPVSLPGTTTFGINVDFGTRAPNINAGTSVSLRVVLFGFYKNVVEIA